MRIIISPAKRMKEDGDCLTYQGFPIFLDETSRIMKWMQTPSLEEVKTLWECNDRLARKRCEHSAD